MKKLIAIIITVMILANGWFAFKTVTRVKQLERDMYEVRTAVAFNACIQRGQIEYPEASLDDYVTTCRKN